MDSGDNYWGRYAGKEPVTRYDPLQTFVEDNQPVGFRVNLVPGRGKRPREQYIKVPQSYLSDPVTNEERDNSPLYRVIVGREPCIPLDADELFLSEPDATEVVKDFTAYRGVSIMNKFSPLGIFSEQASGVAMVNYPTKYIRTLRSPQLNYDLLLPMRTSLHHFLEEESYRDDLKAPLAFFNIGPSSGSSLKYLHSQSYVMPRTEGMNTYAYRRAFEANSECLTCRIANQSIVKDHLGQVIDYSQLTVWEDKYCRIIVPYAPFRTMGTRIIPKKHTSYLGRTDDDTLHGLGKALAVADYLMNASISSRRKPQPDRTIPFRQTSHVGRDFHMFIDVLPPFPILAAESADLLGLSPYSSEQIVERMTNVERPSEIFDYNW